MATILVKYSKNRPTVIKCLILLTTMLIFQTSLANNSVADSCLIEPIKAYTFTIDDQRSITININETCYADTNESEIHFNFSTSDLLKNDSWLESQEKITSKDIVKDIWGNRTKLSSAHPETGFLGSLPEKPSSLSWIA